MSALLMPSSTLRPARMISWPVAAASVLVIAALVASSASATVILGGCVVLALIGPAQSLQALAISTLVIFANPNFVHSGPMAGVLDRVVLVAAMLRNLPTMRATDFRLLWPLWLLSIVAAMTSAASSPAFAVSLTKVITFGLASTTVVVAAGRLKVQQLRRLQTWFTTVGFTVIGLSALTVVRPALAYGSGGLQGLIDQPQAFAVFVAPFAAWSLTGTLFLRRQGGWLDALIGLGCIVLIYFTRARTGISAVFLALSIVLVGQALSRRSASHAPLGKPLLILVFAAAATLVLALSTGGFSSFVRDFAFKGTEGQNHNLGEAFYASRGGGAAQQWQNFRTSPLTGHGFGVYPDGVFPSGVVEFHGIPISAPVEKGFLPTAILEECGIVGGAALALLIAWFGRGVWRGSDLRWRAMFVAAIAINLGECVFLAPGGIGMLHWLMIALALQGYRLDLAARSTGQRGIERVALSASGLPGAPSSTAPA